MIMTRRTGTGKRERLPTTREAGRLGGRPSGFLGPPAGVTVRGKFWLCCACVRGEDPLIYCRVRNGNKRRALHLRQNGGRRKDSGLTERAA